MELTIKTEIEGINVTLTKDAVIQLLTQAIRSEKNEEQKYTADIETAEDVDKEMEEEFQNHKKSYVLNDTISDVVARTKAKAEGVFSVRNTTDDNSGLYKGFLLIRCEDCGSVRGFCAKQPIDKFRCEDCGGTTKLEELRPAFQECKCGRTFKYKTNEKSEVITNKYIDCGSPVDMMLNSRRTAYITIR